MKSLRKFVWVGILVILLTACAQSKSIAESVSPPSAEIILATTTSTYDSGLLDAIIPVFEQQSGYTVKIVAVGTGKALAMGREGNADLLLVHAPPAEKEFMDEGFGSERFLVMHNDFVFVGPATDPAEIKGMESPLDVLTQIAETESFFITRGDDSGTNKKELAFWGDTGITPEGDWYLESGQGMGATLRIASEKNAYTLTDRSTYLAQQNILASEILVEGHESLLNVYHVMIVNPELWENTNLVGAQTLAAFIVSEEGQKMIGEFGIDIYGQPLFFPDADKTDADLGLEP
ncbi:MAG: substrate-binding domain-containing protein [Anaerolineales bacterium]|nr:substrate-binding domain-containing protein [Chloroflexota bacterium]MBL6983267.1 substrate-binding domain-containing protein [Anaerolineales bacterium]